MARLTEWFPGFCKAVVERSARTDWPEPGGGYWSDVRRMLVEVEATWEQADRALSAVLDTPKLFISDFRPLLKAEILRRQQQPVPAAGADRNALEAASRHCPECSGTGLATRHVHEDILGYFRGADGSPVPVGYSMSIHCSCPYGRFLARSGPDGKPRPTIDDHPTLRRRPYPWATTVDGQDNRYRHRPADWCEALDRPYAAEAEAIRDLADLKAYVAALAASARPPRMPQDRSRQLGSIVRRSGGDGRDGGPPAAPQSASGRIDLTGAIGDPVIDRELGIVEPGPPDAPGPAPAPAPAADDEDEDDIPWF